MASIAGDAALDALFVPFATGAIPMPAGEALFLGARAGAWLHAWPRAKFACVQTSRPLADALERAGARTVPASGSPRCALVLALPPRQRDESRALLAHALQCALPGGLVVASQPNNAGARSGEADLERLAGPLRSLSKHHCRVFWATASGDAIDGALAAEWLGLDRIRPIAGGRFVSRPGLFAWDRIDATSALLAAHLPDTLRGRVADLGAGYGYLACEIVRRCPGVVALDLYEAEQRALEPARINLGRAMRDAGREPAIEVLWHDVSAGLPRRYDAIVGNPPFHQGRADRPELGRAFIVAAAQALLPDGVLWLVANRHLAYEATLEAGFAEVRHAGVRDGFKVIEARRPRR